MTCEELITFLQTFPKEQNIFIYNQHFDNLFKLCKENFEKESVLKFGTKYNRPDYMIGKGDFVLSGKEKIPAIQEQALVIFV